MATGRTPHSTGTGFTGGGERRQLRLAEQSWAAPVPPHKICGLAVRWCSAHLPGRFLQKLQVQFQVQQLLDTHAHCVHDLPAKAWRPESNSSMESEVDRFIGGVRKWELPGSSVADSAAFIRVRRIARRLVALRVVAVLAFVRCGR
ncbi:hypothetical protein PAHAL_4G107700 [Panicum hallii]|uniref:Uncharacterized protein n=1 Tax=Panicum hallii TaxID=206008 RepID=A0A2T8JCK6_9POAL|nr:hypothetical protein PAHAL_4G107700 [Panicum hallii]